MKKNISQSPASQARRKKLLERFLTLLKDHGEEIRRGVTALETFRLCSDYGFDLDGSTIDRVQWDGEDLMFFYNENTGDCDPSEEFSETALQRFCTELERRLPAANTGFSLSPDQKKLTEEFEKLAEKMYRAGIHLFCDTENNEMFAFSVGNPDTVLTTDDACFPSYGDEWTDVTEQIDRDATVLSPLIGYVHGKDTLFKIGKK